MPCCLELVEPESPGGVYFVPEYMYLGTSSALRPRQGGREAAAAARAARTGPTEPRSNAKAPQLLCSVATAVLCALDGIDQAKMSSSLPLQLAETIQTAHIVRHPSPRHDLAPGTAADRKEPVRLQAEKLDGEPDDDDDDSPPPYHAIRVRGRSAHLPPLPDLRFEQSYLHSLGHADAWWKVAWVTLRDQVPPCLPTYAHSLPCRGRQLC